MEKQLHVQILLHMTNNLKSDEIKKVTEQKRKKKIIYKILTHIIFHYCMGVDMKFKL
jgi:hypothetical protein